MQLKSNQILKSSKSFKVGGNYIEKLIELLSGELDFHGCSSSYSSHNFHSFPAKFPPQLPNKFILNLTQPGEIVLDPMVGSGTTVLESVINNRKAIGFDIDPLAIMISKVKSTVYSKSELIDTFNFILDDFSRLISSNNLSTKYDKFDQETKDFIEYWFYRDTIPELLALSQCISKIENLELRMYFQIIFSAIIITKSGGVSLALDLAHTRPHRAKKVYNSSEDLILNFNGNYEGSRSRFIEKKLKSPIMEFKKKFYQNIEHILQNEVLYNPKIDHADSQCLPVADNYVDLIVTSPPYASHAIDYMRAHKFSLVWFGYEITQLKNERARYIGGDAISKYNFENMPSFTNSVIKKIKIKSDKKSLVLHRYYSEMSRVLKEMYRVLKPGRSAVLVVGNSNICGVSSETHLCLEEIGKNIGFEIPKIGIRKIDRNRRMLPATLKKNFSQILNRMHEEYIIGFYKK